MASDDIWYYTRNGERIGPVTELELSNTVARGDLRPDELVWKEGMPQWVQLRFAEGLPAPPPSDSTPAPAAPYAEPHPIPAAPQPVAYGTPAHALVTYASFGQRFVASLIDNLILLVLRFGCVLPFGMVGAVLDDQQGPSESRDAALGLAVLVVWALVGCVPAPVSARL